MKVAGSIPALSTTFNVSAIPCVAASCYQQGPGGGVIPSFGPGNGPHHTAEPPAKGWSVLAPKISPPLSWDGRDDGQQAWVAERSTTLTRSSRIETAISRRGRQGSAVGCRILYLGPRGRSWRSYDGGVWVADSKQARLNEGLSFDPSVRMAGVGMQIGMAVESLPVLLPLPPHFPLRWSMVLSLGSRLYWRWPGSQDPGLLKRLEDAGSSPAQRLKKTTLTFYPTTETLFLLFFTLASARGP